jgi:hypothetical protein
MPVYPFLVEQGGTFAGVPDPAGELVIIRSTSELDISPMSLQIGGTVAAVPDGEALALSALDGRIERQSTKLYQAINTLSLSDTPSGSIIVYGQGVAAHGNINLPSGGPVAGGILRLGLNGFEKTYTWRAGAAWLITTLAVASLGQGDYIDVTIAGVVNRFWFDIDAAGTGAPSNPGTLTEVDVVTGGTADDVADALQAAIDTLTTANATVDGDEVTVTAEILGTMTVADGAGGAATGFTLASTVTGTAGVTDGDVLIGGDRFQTIRNLAHAINAGTGSGTLYGSGTSANAYASAFSDSTRSTSTFDGTSHGTAYIQDRMAVERLLSWSLDSTEEDFSLVAPASGSMGVVIATLDANAQTLSEAMEFNNPGLATDLDNGRGLLQALSLPTSAALYIGGHASTLRLLAANYANPVTVDVDFSEDAANWTSLGAAIVPMDNNDQILYIGPVEYLRFRVTANANTSDVALHAAVTKP